MTRFSDKEKLDCAVREARYRSRVYTRMVADGRMKADHAAYQIGCMEAIADDYRAKLKAEFAHDNPQLFS